MLPLDELYQEVILDHYQSVRNQGEIANPDIKGHGVNPFCGDEVEFSLALGGDIIQDLKVHGKGCSISQASLSMMSEALKSQKLSKAIEMANQFKEAMLENTPLHFETYEDLEALEGVKKFPVRIKCALLAWNTFLESIPEEK